MTDRELLKLIQKRHDELELRDSEFRARVARDQLKQTQFTVRLALLVNQYVNPSPDVARAVINQPFILTC